MQRFRDSRELLKSSGDLLDQYAEQALKGSHCDVMLARAMEESHFGVRQTAPGSSIVLSERRPVALCSALKNTTEGLVTSRMQ